MLGALPDSQLRALLTLLADRDESIARACRARLVAEGARAIPALEALTRDADPELASLAIGALRDLRSRAVDVELAAFAADPSEWLDLEVGAILIARTADPDLDVVELRQRLDGLAKCVRERVLAADDPEEVAAALREVLADGAGLRGNTADYYDPENSFLHRVLERGLGIPISLSVIYLLVARRAGLDVSGIGMPGHFVLSLGGTAFLDPFNQARALTRDDCLAFLERTGFGRDDSLLAETPDRFVLARMLANLLNVYKKRNDVDSVERYRKLFDLFRGATGK